MSCKFSFLCICVFLCCGNVYPQKREEVHGSGTSPQQLKFLINQPFCSERSGPYKYLGGEISNAASVAVQDVTAPIKDFNAFDDPGTSIISTSKTSLMSDGSNAARLLARSFFAGTCTPSDSTPKAPGSSLLAVSYYVINIVVWKKSVSSGKNFYQVQSSEWYLFNIKDKSVSHQSPLQKFHPALSANDRIYGSSTIGFLAIHLQPPAATGGADSFTDFSTLKISYNVTVKEKLPINVQDLIDLIGVITKAGGAAAGVAPEDKTQQHLVTPTKVGLYGGGLIGPIKKLPDDIEFTANVEFPSDSSKKSNLGWKPDTTLSPRLISAKFTVSPFPGRNEVDQAPPAAPAPTTTSKPTANCATTEDSTTHVQTPCSFSKTYDNEGLYHWDVSVAVPVNSINELQYSSTDGSVTTKQVSRLNAYGLFDIFPVASDLKTPPAFAWPHLIVGLPFSGKVFNKPFFGGGGVVNFQQIPKIGPALAKIVPVKLNFYGGVVYNKEFRPSSLNVGDPGSPAAVANSLSPHRVWKGQFGIEFSIRDVKDKLSSTKSSTAKSDTSKATAGS